MKIKETYSGDLKTKMADEMSKVGVFSQGSDGVQAANSFIRSIPEGKNKKEEIIRKPLYKGVADKLVSTKKIKKPIGKLTTGLPIMGEKKTESTESTGSGSAGGFSAPLFSTTKKEMEENTFKAPKLTMFSDEAPKPKKEMKESCWSGYKQVGTKDKNGKKVPNCVPVNEGKEKYCDSCDRVKSKCVCGETKKVEATEATGSASSGSYETNAAWAKSTSKKDWRGKSKTQIPGGKFVQVKKKCKKFPYCNQGDIKALKIFENDTVKKVITNISKKHNISENVIKTILSYEYENSKSNK
jgi:hypothetical protein